MSGAREGFTVGSLFLLALHLLLEHLAQIALCLSFVVSHVAADAVLQSMVQLQVVVNFGPALVLVLPLDVEAG